MIPCWQSLPLKRAYSHTYKHCRACCYSTRSSDVYYNNNTNNKGKNTATTSTPASLTPTQHELLSAIIRVDQAGEIAANSIYAGQYAVLKNSPVDEPLIAAMWDGEKRHLETFNKLQVQHRIRPTLISPIAHSLGYALGYTSALFGREAAMACTEAVETVIGEHYDDQLKAIRESLPQDDSIQLLSNVIEEFRDDELDHLDTAVENHAHQAPAHALFCAVVAGGCKVAIEICKKI